MQIIWRPSAIQDTERARRYISQFDPEAATRIFEGVRATIQTLATSPDSGRVGRVADTRELAVPRTPYVVAYTVVDNQFVVLAIIHHAQEWPHNFQR